MCVHACMHACARACVCISDFVHNNYYRVVPMVLTVIDMLAMDVVVEYVGHTIPNAF